MAEKMSKEAEMSITVSALFPGFRFSPTDVELICYYLQRKIDGDEKSVEVIPEVEIYKFEPWDLPAQSIIKSENEWFFFCSRGRKYPHGSQSRRATELGYWKATGKERNVKSGSNVIGTKRTLVFHIGRAPRGERTEWIMHEYRMIGVPQDGLVVCRLKKNSEFRASSSQRQTEEGPCVTSEGVTEQTGGASEGDKTIDSCSPSESEQKMSNDNGESSNHIPQDPNDDGEDDDGDDDDCYAEILNDDIINLDHEEPVLQQKGRSQALKSNPIFEETLYAEVSKDRNITKKPGFAREGESEERREYFFAFFETGNVNGRRLKKSFIVLALFIVLVSMFWTIVLDKN